MGLALQTKFRNSETNSLTCVGERTQLSLSADTDDYTRLQVTGLALPFAETYESIFAAIRFAPTAFDRSLERIAQGQDHAYFAADGHSLDALYVLGKTTIPFGEGAMELWVEADGLHFSVELLDDFVGRAIYKRIEMGILDKVSVGVNIKSYSETTFDLDGREVPGYVYDEVELCEISGVSFPAFRQTNLEVLADSDDDDDTDSPDDDDDEYMSDEMIRMLADIADRAIAAEREEEQLALPPGAVVRFSASVGQDQSTELGDPFVQLFSQRSK